MFGRFLDVNCREEDGIISINNVNGRDMDKFISNYWKTISISKYMFTKVAGGRFGKLEFYSFFAIDVLYILETLANQRSGRVPARTLALMAEALKEESWLHDVEETKFTPKLNFDKLKLFRFEPKVFQRSFLEYYNEIPSRYRLNGALLNGAAGTGKSLSSLMTMECSEVDKVIIVCPKNAVNRVWESEINLHLKKVPEYWVSSDTKEPDIKTTKYFIYHYETLEKAIVHHAKYFGKYHYGLVLDESHNLNDIKSNRTQRWLELCKLSGSNNILHASGTPFKAMGSEAIPLLRAIDPMFIPKAEERFKAIFGSSAQRGLDILKNRLGLVSFKIEKEELGLEPPEMIILPIKVKDSERFTLVYIREEMKRYIEDRMLYYRAREKEDLEFYKSCLDIFQKECHDRKLLQDFDTYIRFVKRIQGAAPEYSLVKDEISFCRKFEFYTISKYLPSDKVKAFRSVCSVIKYLALKIQGECLGNVVGRARIEAHQAMCRAVPFRDITNTTKKKTVVFTSFVDVLEEADKVCKEQALNPIIVYGKTNKDLNNLINRFEKDESLNPLIATYDSLSTAVPLVMADTMIMLNAPFRAYIQEQAISRIHRLRQDSQTRVYQCYLDTGPTPNISTRSLDIMKWSQEQVEKITGVASPYSLDDTKEGDVLVTTEGLDESLDRLVRNNSMAGKREFSFRTINPRRTLNW